MERSTLTATVDQFSKNGQQYFGQSIGSIVATAQLMGVRAQGIAAIATPNDQRRSFKGRYQAQQRAFIKRSEEHTSELQSLMRISYAVFCLKKKKQNTLHNTTVL